MPENLKEARKHYWAAIKKAQHKAYKEFIQNVEGCSAMSMFNKNFDKEATSNRQLELFDHPDGTKMTPEETLSSLGKAKFPNCRDEDEQAPYTEAGEILEATASYNLLNDNRADFITLEKTKAALLGFSPCKAVGTDDLPPTIYQHFGNSPPGA